MYNTNEIDLIFNIIIVTVDIIISIFKYIPIILYYVLYILINILDFFDDKYEYTLIKTLIASIIICYLIKLWRRFYNWIDRPNNQSTFFLLK